MDFAKRVGRVHQEAVREPAVQLHLKRLVVGALEPWISRVGRAAEKNVLRLDSAVPVPAIVAALRLMVPLCYVGVGETDGVVAHVRQFQRKITRQQTLDGEIPGLRVRYRNVRWA